MQIEIMTHNKYKDTSANYTNVVKKKKRNLRDSLTSCIFFSSTFNPTSAAETKFKVRGGTHKRRRRFYGGE